MVCFQSIEMVFHELYFKDLNFLCPGGFLFSKQYQFKTLSVCLSVCQKKYELRLKINIFCKKTLSCWYTRFKKQQESCFFVLFCSCNHLKDMKSRQIRVCGFGKMRVFELVINFGNCYMTRIAQYYVFLTSICFLYKDVSIWQIILFLCWK